MKLDYDTPDDPAVIERVARAIARVARGSSVNWKIFVPEAKAALGALLEDEAPSDAWGSPEVAGRELTDE